MSPEDLVEIEAIKRVKYAYFRCIDQKRWDELAAVFTTDVVAAYSGGRYQFEGPESIIEWMRAAMDADTFHSSHRGTHPEIDLTSADEAHGVWAFDDTVIEMSHNITMTGAGFYDDLYRKVDGGWLIAKTSYIRTFEDVQVRDGSPPKLSASQWTTGGVSRLKH